MLLNVLLASFCTLAWTSCDEQGAVASNLTAAIMARAGRSAWHITAKVPRDHDIGPITNGTKMVSVSMDCLEISKGVQPETLLGVFHAGEGGEGKHNALYVAKASASNGAVPGAGDWTVTGKLSASGSMGFVKVAPDGIQILMAYELENSSGNRIAIRLYPSLENLQRGGYWLREVQLTRYVRSAGGKMILAKNIGTPSISSVSSNADGSLELTLYFHYYTSSDIPGAGTVTFPASGDGVVSQWYNWQGFFAANQNNAMRMAQAVGKIGQRAELRVGGHHFQLYEAQMANAGEGYQGWLSWRLFLYEDACEGKPASQLRLTLDSHLQTFANPHATVVGGWLYLGAFIPGEPFDEAKTKTYATYDAARCPSCASNPMIAASAPAQPGSFLRSVRLSEIFHEQPGMPATQHGRQTTIAV